MHWLDSSFVPMDFKNFGISKFDYTIRFAIENQSGIFFDFWFIFDEKSDGKDEIQEFEFLKSIGIKFECNHSKCNLALYYACIICTSDWSFSYPWLRGFRCGLISNVSLCLKLTFIDQGQRSTKKWTYTLRHKVDQIHLVEGWCSSVTNFRLILI